MLPMLRCQPGSAQTKLAPSPVTSLAAEYGCNPPALHRHCIRRNASDGFVLNPGCTVKR